MRQVIFGSSRAFWTSLLVASMAGHFLCSERVVNGTLQASDHERPLKLMYNEAPCCSHHHYMLPS